MTIEEAFKETISISGPRVIFNPLPAYDGDLPIPNIGDLSRNSLKDQNGQNLFDEFYSRTYRKPLIEIFGTENILNFKVGMISVANEDKKGRGLRYSKVDFFVSLIKFLNQNIDNYKNKTEQAKSDYLDELISHIKKSNEQLNLAFSEKLKSKYEILKDIDEKQINSEYYDSALADYALYENLMTFTQYIKSMMNITKKYQEGMLKLGDFFDRNIDFYELYKSFDPDTFYLLFAKIIYDFNVKREKEDKILDNSYIYLCNYIDAIRELVKSDKKYNPKILYTGPNGKKMQISRWEVQEDIKKLLERHPEAKRFKLPILNDIEMYSDIDLMGKITYLLNSQIELNWEFLPKGDGVKTGFSNSEVRKELIEKNKKPKTREELVAFTNLRIELMNNSGYLAIIKGTNTFDGYYAYIYPNGSVILEKFWRNEAEMIPVDEEATYVMNIDNFIEMSKKTKITLIEYIRTLPEVGVKRIYHTTINNWWRNVEKVIKGTTYDLETVIAFINNLNNGERKNE